MRALNGEHNGDFTPSLKGRGRGLGRNMPAKNIVTGQKVDRALVERAKTLRRDMTAEETILWQHLRADRLHGYHFRRQQIIDRFIADFYCHVANLVIEVDGPIHENRRAYDQERDARIATRGLTILRFNNDQVRQDLPSVLETILRACQDAADSAPTASPPRNGEGSGEG